MEEDIKYIQKVLNNMKIDNKERFMSAVANVMFEHNKALKNSVSKDKIIEILDEYENVLASEESAIALYSRIKELLKGDE